MLERRIPIRHPRLFVGHTRATVALKRAWTFACLAFMSGGMWLPAQAAEPPPPATSERELRVGVYVSPPFVERQAGAGFTGMAITLWETAARDLGWRYRYREVATYDALVEGLERGDLDVAVTNITVTQERAKRMDFTHPWYDAGMRLMVPKAHGSGRLLDGLKEGGHLRIYAVLAGILVVATWLLTLVDRKYDREFTRNWTEGLAESFFHVVSVTVSGKTDHKKMFGPLGRIVSAVWLLCGVALVAYVTSSVTSVMTAESLNRQINGVSDLKGRSICVAAGSTADKFAADMGLTVVRHRGVDDAARALANGDCAAIVGDAPVLEHYAHTRPESGLEVVGVLFNPDKYGFGLRHGSQLQKPLTIQLLGLQESGQVETLRSRYFGKSHN